MNRELFALIRRSNRICSLLAGILLCLGSTRDLVGQEHWVLRDDGIGPIKIGMTPTQMKGALHQSLQEEESGSENCYYVRALGHRHLAFMIEDGKLSRIDVDARGIATSTGIQVGDSEKKVREIYGSKLAVTEHKYIDTGHYFTVRSSKPGFGIRFETDKGKIFEFYAGKYESIQYVEGCL